MRILRSSERCWRLQALLTCSLLLLETASSQYLLTKTTLKYMDVVAQLFEPAGDPDLPSKLSDVATDIGFSVISYSWEAPFNAVDTEFAQVLIGRKDSACYAVFHGLPITEDFPFVADPKPIDNLQRQNCNSDTSDCSCRAHWGWVDLNFPQYWQKFHEQLEDCMTSCTIARNDECDLVLGGHGMGGSVATLLSLYFASTIYDPYVITAGAADVMYDKNCEGINQDRYFRFINTDTPGSGVNSMFEILYLYGVCFDDVPFIGASELYGLGTTIAMGLEKGGMALATGGTGQLNTLEDEATRSSVCRSAHNLLNYQQKMQSAVWRNPEGVTPWGFTNFQYCEVNQDCWTTSACEPSTDYPICTTNTNPVAPQPTPRPTQLPSPRPTARPTTAPTAFPTSQPSPGPTARPSPQPTPGPTLQPSPCPTAKPTPYPTTPGPSAKPTVEPTTARPTNFPTSAPKTPAPAEVSPPQPTRNPTLAPTINQDSTLISTGTPTKKPTIAPSVTTTAAPSSRPTETNPTENATSGPTAAPTAGPTSSAASPSEASDAATDAPTLDEEQEDATMAPSEHDQTRQPTPTSAPSAEGMSTEVAETLSPTSWNKNPPVDYESNDEATMAPTQKPVQSPPPTLSNSALPLFDAFFRTTLVLQNVREQLTGFTMFWWEDETSDFLREWIQMHTEENNWDPPIVQLRVQANIVSQSVLFVAAPVDVERSGRAPEQASVSSAKEFNEEDIPSENTKKADKSSRRSSKRSNKGTRIRRRRRRRLQQQPPPNNVAESLQIVFEIAIAYRTLNPADLDLYGLILEAFSSKRGRSMYSARLYKSNDEVFENLSNFVLQIQESPNAVETDAVNKQADKTIIWALIAAASAAVVLALGLFLWYFKRVNTKGQKLDDYDSKKSNSIGEKAIFEPASASIPRVSPDGAKAPRVSQEIVVDGAHDDGISTLGEPPFYPGAPPIMQDEQTASTAANYAQNYMKMHDRYDDNNRTFRSDQHSSCRSTLKDTVSGASAQHSALSLSKVGSGLTNYNEISAIFSDDDSFEQAFAGQDECFKVLAPPGKLGMIIDLSGNGEPMVRAIRGDSALADKVRIGDRLLSVDGEGCAEMTAEHVSKLIAEKSNQPTREIMFVRKKSDYM